MESLAAEVGSFHLADEQHQRRGVLGGGMNAHSAVHGARPPSHKRHARFAGEFAVGFGHVDRARFVPGGEQADLLTLVV